MKSFKKFITEIQNRESPFHGNVRPGSNYPKNLPYIRDPKKEMDLFRLRFKARKRRDVGPKEMKNYQDKLNNEYFNSPQINPPILDPLKKIKA